MYSVAYASTSNSALLQTSAETIGSPRCPLFRTNFASISLLNCYQQDGYPPERKFWNWEQAQERLATTQAEATMGSYKPTTFALKVEAQRDWRKAQSDAKKRAKGIDPLAPEALPIDQQRASLRSKSVPNFSLDPMGEHEKPLTRADLYYQSLLKADKKRQEFYLKKEWDEKIAKATKAAQKAKSKTVKNHNKETKRAERQSVSGGGKRQPLDSSSSDDSDLDVEDVDADMDEDFGPLQPYPGVMKVEVEVVVLRAPGDNASDSESESESTATEDKATTATDSNASSRTGSARKGGGVGGKGGSGGVAGEDGVAGDDGDGEAENEEEAWLKELQALQEEFAEPEKAEESDNDSIPDGLFGKTMGNVHDNLSKRTALGLGGTAFFVPDVERYAIQPSLLPPPPRGEGFLQKTGHRRLKLKPRLPLEVSRNRWRDEHPYGCPPEAEFSPNFDDMYSFEEKVRRVELYGTLTNIISSMPKPDGFRKIPNTDLFERSLDHQLKDSLAWKQYIKRQRLMELAKVDGAAEAKSKANAMMAGYKPKKGKGEKGDDLPEFGTGRPETGAYRNLPPSKPLLDERRGDYMCTPLDTTVPCGECEAKGFWHDDSDGIPHQTAWNKKCAFCKTCKTCRGRGKIRREKTKEESKLPTAVPPLTFPATASSAAFVSGQISPRAQSVYSSKHSPKRHVGDHGGHGSLMSVAGGIRKAAPNQTF